MAKKMKMSGVIGDLDKNDSDYRRVLIDSGGIVLLRDFELNCCGDYHKGDRIVVTVEPCEPDKHYYPPKPH